MRQDSCPLNSASTAGERPWTVYASRPGQIIRKRNGTAGQWDFDVAQLIKRLPSLHEALGLIPSTAKPGCGV